MFDLPGIQAALREFGFDGWLLYDFRGSNVLAQRVLGITGDAVGSRRYFYCIPAEGEPRKLVHRIEAGALDHLPGSKTVYLKWQELEAGVAALLDGLETVAMEYSPRNANPYISRVDAGTIELVRSCGVRVVPSGDLIQMFEAVLSDEQWRLHLEAAKHTDSAFARAWRFIADRVAAAGAVEETAVRREIMDHFAEHGMTTYHPPIVAVNANSGDPHYETGTGLATAIRTGDFVLIDLWAKIDHPDGVYSDLTRVGFLGAAVPEKYNEVFHIVSAARDAAIDCVRSAFAEIEPAARRGSPGESARRGSPDPAETADRRSPPSFKSTANGSLQGWQVDRAAREVIERAGYGEYFVHRTGHSIGRETHGNGANMDDLETREDRRVLPRTLFSIEPGIYLPEFGVRSEVNVFVDPGGAVHVTGGELQSEVQTISC